MSSGARVGALALVLASSFSLPASALAAPTDGPILIRSLAAGMGGDPAAEYVMLEATLPTQDQLSGETLTLYGAAGAVTRSFSIPGNVANGQSQRTILLATQQAASQSGFPAPDFDLGSAASLEPAAGAACLTGSYPADCVTWGTFPPALAAALPDPQLGNAEAIVGAALGRTTDFGCSTWLDRADDATAGGIVFFDGVPPPGGLVERPPPAPRNNATNPTEVPCLLDTIFNSAPPAPTNDPTPTFAFGETPPAYEVRFECRFEAGASLPGGLAWSPCSGSGVGYGPLADGTYAFQARAIGAAGSEPQPASWVFDVDTVPPDTIVDSAPPEPSNGVSARFTYHSSEPLSKFRCQFESGAIQSCDEGKTLFSLADGSHALRVWAVDQAANVDPTPAVVVFNVDTSLGDTSAPDTTIVSRPTNPTSAARASFTYRSSEPRSTFQCSLDGATFVPCDAAGASYSSLRNGPHAFRVAATDRAGNTDSAAAAFAWNVRAPLPDTLITASPPGFSRIRGQAKTVQVSFRFRAGDPGARFRCRIDKQAFRSCGSPQKLRTGPGRHRFEVYAIDAVGNVEKTPARRIFRIGGDPGRGFFRALLGGAG